MPSPIRLLPAFEDAKASFAFAESDSPEILRKEIVKYLLPRPAGEDADDHVIAWHFLQWKCLFWREDTLAWHRLAWAKGNIGIDQVSSALVENEAINFVAQLDRTNPGALFPSRRGCSVTHLARRVVKAGKIYSKPGAPGFNPTEEFIRAWLTKVKDGVVGTRTTVPLRTYVMSQDLYRLYRVYRKDTRSARAIRADLAGAVRTVFKLGRSHNLPNQLTGKGCVRGWWGLDFAKPLPQGFYDEGVPADGEDGLRTGGESDDF